MISLWSFFGAFVPFFDRTAVKSSSSVGTSHDMENVRTTPNKSHGR